MSKQNMYQCEVFECGLNYTLTDELVFLHTLLSTIELQ